MKALTKVVPSRVIVLYPDTRGFAYAVMEDETTLTEYNLYDFYRFSRERTLELMREVIRTHGPATLVLEDVNCRYSRKGHRTKELIRSIAAWARKKEVNVEYYSREQIRWVFNHWGARTKYQIAKYLSERIEALSPIMYDKPKYPDREKSIEAVFSAVSLGVTHQFFTN